MPCAFHAERPEPFHVFPSECQFNVSKDLLIEVDGRMWCEFHAPLKDEAENNTVKGEWENRRITEFNKYIHSLIQRTLGANKSCDLSGVIFPGDISFSGQVFPAIIFYRVEFHGEVNFQEAQFRKIASFESAKFLQGEALFRRSCFNDHAIFDNVCFVGGGANFNSAIFEDRVSFTSAIFNHDAWFVDAQFGDFSFFNGGQFKGDAAFSVLRKNKKNCTFQIITFRGVNFHKFISFINRDFQNSADFNFCEFGQAPRFQNCTLHQDTKFVGVKFHDTESEDAAQNYRTLKLAMENARSRQDEAMFYALEQKSIRKRKDTPRLVKVVSVLYEEASDYGQSLGLPLAWLMLVSFLFFLFYGELAEAASADCLNKIGIFGFTVQQIVRPFEVWRTVAGSALSSCVSLTGLRLIATLQSILSLSLLALAFLALRRRFRMG